MGFFRSKAPTNDLFGAGITPSCAYCTHNTGEEENIVCPYAPLIEAFRSKADFYCRHYVYDPLLRRPQSEGACDAEEKQ